MPLSPINPVIPPPNRLPYDAVLQKKAEFITPTLFNELASAQKFIEKECSQAEIAAQNAPSQPELSNTLKAALDSDFHKLQDTLGQFNGIFRNGFGIEAAPVATNEHFQCVPEFMSKIPEGYGLFATSDEGVGIAVKAINPEGKNLLSYIDMLFHGFLDHFDFKNTIPVINEQVHHVGDKFVEAGASVVQHLA